MNGYRIHRVLAILACLGFAGFDGAIGQQLIPKGAVPGQPAKKEVRAYLNLPYHRTFSRDNTAGLSIEMLDGLIGTRGFAAVSSPGKRPRSTGQSSSIFYLSFCSSDLTLFDVEIRTFESCKEACDSILALVTGRTPQWNLIPEIFVSVYGKNGDLAYTLLQNIGPLQMWQLNFEHGMLVSVRHASSHNQPLKAPVSNEVLIAQMELLHEGIASFLDRGTQSSGEKVRVYERLKERYLSAKNRPVLKNVRNTTGRFSIDLFELPASDAPGGTGAKRLTRATEVFVDNPYILARADGGSLPVIKIAEPQNFTASVSEPVLSHEAGEEVRDILLDSDSLIDTSLRSDGLYQIRFRREQCLRCFDPTLECDCLESSVGDRRLRVYCFGPNGTVISWGELTVNARVLD